MFRALGLILSALSVQFPSWAALRVSDGLARDQVEIQKLWGVYSPFHAEDDYAPLPPGCELSQVNILHRHGARLPSESQTEEILHALNKLLAVPQYADPRLDFLHRYQYTHGQNLLVPLGAMQSAASGATAYRRYARLLAGGDTPFVRASGMSRVIDSATNWTAGFGVASGGISLPRLSVILDEQGNDTLQDNNCPNGDSSHHEMNRWFDTYAPPIAGRLNTWAPGANITNKDVHSLQMLCAFETVASVPADFELGSPLPFSSFCQLFTPDEFVLFAYAADIDRYYSTGYGSSLGRVQGVGYVNELIARLTSSPVEDYTSTNRTLDSDPVTFPLNRTVYADFTHDSPEMAIFGALGLFPTPHLKPTHPKSDRRWKTSDIMTFSSRMVVEKLECRQTVRGSTASSTSFVRIFENEVLQPLPFCGAAETGAFRGLCSLNAFLKSQMYARENGKKDWERCFEA